MSACTDVCREPSLAQFPQPTPDLPLPCHSSLLVDHEREPLHLPVPHLELDRALTLPCLSSLERVFVLPVSAREERGERDVEDVSGNMAEPDVR